jgi:toxin ParE1/3/4
MTYRVDLTPRAGRDLRRIFRDIDARESSQARDWFNGLEAALLSLDEHPARGAIIPEGENFRHLLYGRKPHVYRIIYAIDDAGGVVSVLHIRHGGRDAFASQSKDD